MSEELGLNELKVYTLSLIGLFLFNEISLSISLFCCCTFTSANSLFVFFISLTSLIFNALLGMNVPFKDAADMYPSQMTWFHLYVLSYLSIQRMLHPLRYISRSSCQRLVRTQGPECRQDTLIVSSIYSYLVFSNLRTLCQR